LKHFVKIALLFLLFSDSFSIFSQEKNCTCTLKGVVHDHENHLPVVGAVLYLKGTNISTFTDANGNYQFSKLCQGTYTLVCRAVSFDLIETKINLQDSHNEDITLENKDEHLQEVVVTSQKTSLDNKAVLSGKNLEATRGQSLGEALKNISGVTTLQTGSFIQKPVINGMHSNRVIILNNGIRQEGQQWGSEHAPEIDPFVAKKLTVIKGVSGLRYGSDAIGGIVMVEPESLPDSAKIHGEINVVGFSNGRQKVLSGILEGGISGFKGFGWRLQGTYKRGGNISTPTYNLINTGIQERNFSVGFGLNKTHFGAELFYSYFDTQIGIFTGSHIGNVQDLQQAILDKKPAEVYTPTEFSEEINRPNQDVAHHLLKVKSFLNSEIFGKFNFVSAYQYNWRLEYDVPRGNRSLNTLNFKLDTYSSELTLEHRPIFQILNGTAGISAQYQQNLSSAFELRKSLISTTLLPNYQTISYGIFLVERYLKNDWETELGIRYDTKFLEAFSLKIGGIPQQNTFNFNNFSGAFGLKKHHSENWESNLNLGLVWRSPSVNELFTDGIHHGSASYEKGNLNLRPEVANNLSFSTNYHNAKFIVETSIYLKNIQNFIYLKPRIQDDTLRSVLTVRGAFPAFDYTQVDAQFAGFDFSVLYKPLVAWELSAKISIVRAKDVRNNLFMVNIPSDRFDQTVQYNFKKNQAFISISHQYVARQNRVEKNSDFLAPPEGYSLITYRSGLTISKLNFGLTISNLFNQTYREYLNRFRYYADDMGRNISLRINYKF
jgi:iron complex outermembrane recepter protein